jgi:serine/threonine protein kinase
MLLATGNRLGPYVIVAPLGAGGMGEVYRAMDTKLDREVAIKILPEALARDPERLRRFEREAKILAALNHPNIAQIYAIEEGALVMELVEGQTLHGPLPVGTALHYAHQLADALEAAHEKGIIHRDLKPANIMVTATGVVKVLDFGLAAVAQRETQAETAVTLTTSPTRAGMILGTAGYMSPEQARGKPVDRRADIWAFGVVLYEMLTGRKLFAGETISDTLSAVLTKEPDWNRVPAELQPLLRSCLEKDPKRRLRDIGDAWRMLEIPPQIMGLRHSRLAWIAAGSLAVIALGVSLIHFRERPPETPVVSLSVALPPKTSADSMALSPNGRHMALAMREATGKISLWIRALDSVRLQQLVGTENAYMPFWSPDGKSIAFFADNKLKRIDLAGGPVQTICESGPGRGGTWNRDGVILYARHNSAVMRVSAAGGEPREVTQLGPRESRHYWPWFLPDGRRFLFTKPGPPEVRGVWIASLDMRSEPRRLLGDNSRTMYASGWLLFGRNRAVMAQTFDVARGQLGPEAVPLINEIGTDDLSGGTSFSVSETGHLSYLRASSEQRRLAWLNRNGEFFRAVGERAIISNAILSRDGTRIATDILDAQGNRDIWIIDTRGGTPTRLTFSPLLDWLPSWSPDGKSIAWSSSMGGGLRIYRKLASGASQEEALLSGGLPKFVNDWSPDGRYLLYNEIGSNTLSDLWTLPLAGDRKPFPYLKSKFDERDAAFSPDGRWVAYVSDESAQYQVWVQSFPAGTGKWQISTNVGGALGGTYGRSRSIPRWRRDGRELYYMSGDGKIMAVEVEFSDTFRSGTPQALFDAPLKTTQFDVAADGQKFLLPMPDENTSNEPVHVVLNWVAALTK